MMPLWEKNLRAQPELMLLFDLKINNKKTSVTKAGQLMVIFTADNDLFSGISGY
jgi:hypothetical protein